MANSADVHTGSSFDEFLDEERYRDEVESAAIMRAIALQSAQAMTAREKAVLSTPLRSGRDDSHTSSSLQKRQNS